MDFLILLSKVFGFNNYCPICNHICKTFLPYGVKPREKALCPKCESLERHRLIYLFLKNKTDIFKKKNSLIHFSPEKCLSDILKVKKNINYFTADLERQDVMYKIDLTQIPFKKKAFDNIICIHVLEHINDDMKALKELYRILKPGGWAIIQVPIMRERTYENFNFKTPEERLNHFGQKDHVRIYGKDFSVRLKEAGFKLKIINYINSFNRNLAKYYGITVENYKSDVENYKSEKIYYCYK